MRSPDVLLMRTWQAEWPHFTHVYCCVGRFGYDTSGYFSYVLDNYAAAGIPLETFVADSQYMDRQMIFTLGSNFTISEMDVCPVF